MTSEWFIGIDGGGTKTDLALIDTDGSLVGRVQGSSSNRTVVGPEAAKDVLQSLIDETISQAGVKRRITAGWIGLAGADRPEDKAMFRVALANRIDNIHITNDAELVLSGNPDGIGIALIGGTGSIAFARNEAGVSGRSGGWGHIFGDEGSAYGVAVDALRAVAAATDGRGPETTLTGLLMSHWRVATPQQLILTIYGAEVRKSDIAASAPVIVNAAREGDEVALRLLDSAAVQLASLVGSLLQRVPFATPPSVAVTGGLLLQSPELRALVRQELVDQPCQEELTLVEDLAESAAQAIRIETLKGRA